MENKLYPLKFKPVFKEKIWGGQRIKTILNMDFRPLKNCGEVWLISGVEGEPSVVENGVLAGNELNELIEVYMSDLVGEKIYNKFGNEFPILIKFIDANDYLSVQVHPDDKLAAERHGSYGKTEMWYVIHADEGAKLINGFNHNIDKETYLEHLKNKKLKDILNAEDVHEGDAFFIPAGRVHALCPGILLTEIQQTSDITYRIYDWDRLDENGNSRELHTEEATEAIDFDAKDNRKVNYRKRTNQTSTLVRCPYFTTSLIHFSNAIEKNFMGVDSFVIYICHQGSFVLDYDYGKITVNKADAILVPAEIDCFRLLPETETKVLEVYIEM